MRIKLYRLYILLTLITTSYSGFAQKTKIMGVVIDKISQEPLPFVNIILKNTHIGTITDVNGNFKIETTTSGDFIIATFLGYKSCTRGVIQNAFQVINFELEPDMLQLEEVVVAQSKKRLKNRDNPAITLLDSILSKKGNNNIDKLDSYEYEVYNKIQFDINNITEEFKNRRLLKPFSFIFDYVDTSTVNGKPFLPIFIIESLSDFHHRKRPMDEKEIIKATKVSGIENESVQEFLGDMYININVYDPYINLFGKGFTSPISSIGKMFYKYFLVDSAMIDNNWCYQVAFLPRLKQEYLFNGNFWITDTTYAIKSIELKIDEDVNLNFVNNLEISQEFTRVNDELWMLEKDVLVIDFNIFKNPNKSMGFFGKKTTTYRDHKINSLKEDAFYSTLGNVLVEQGANKKDEEFWSNARHEKLTEKEEQIYAMVDTIKTIPAFRTYYDMILMITTGYYTKGKVELGPYFTTYSFNSIEGHRFRLGGRTSNEFSTNLMLEAYTAYGTKDESFKYGVGFFHLFNKNPRRGVGANYKNDIEQLGQSVNAFREDNILASVLRRSPNNKLSMVQEYKGYYEHEWFRGLSNELTITHREIYPVGMPFFELNGSDCIRIQNTINTSEVTINTRFAYNEKFIMGEFDRISLGTTYPILDVHFTYGFENVIKSDFSYKKLELSVNDWFNIHPIGHSKCRIEAGKIWGVLPYPLLKLHEGNETYSFDQYSFNMMNYYEFVSDQYISLYYSHFFEGLFFNKIPLFKKLKWREVVWCKGVVGSLEDENREVMQLPETLNSLSKPEKTSSLKPYWEAGVGIENIFKLIRVDAIWRLAYLDNLGIAKFGIRASLQLKF